MGYLHGVNTIEKESQDFIIQDADISSVVVIGTMPVFQLENPEKINKITSYNFTGKIGEDIEGFSIPDAVRTILDNSGGANIYTINIYDDNKHSASININLTFVNGIATLEHRGAHNLKVYKGEVLLVQGEDYDFKKNTISIIKTGKIGESQVDVHCEYTYPDFTKITDSDYIGTSTGLKTGLQDNLNCYDKKYAAHTGGGNTGSIGVAVCGMRNFKGRDYKSCVPQSGLIAPICGTDCPIKQVQMERCFRLCAELCKKYNIQITPNTVFTHYEFGLDNPNTESRGKIDINFLPYKKELKPNEIGDYIRGKIKWYRGKM